MLIVSLAHQAEGLGRRGIRIAGVLLLQMVVLFRGKA